MAANPLDLTVAGDALGFVAAAFAGWRYLFSPSYRQRVHARWQSKTQLQIAQDITAAVAGSLFSLFLLWLLISLFAGFDWLTRSFHSASSV